jgi:single-stranded-DNA-specific exonuclease
MTEYIRPREIISLRPSREEQVSALMEQLGISETLSRIIAGRGLTTFEESKRFFNPSLTDFIDPFTFCDMEELVERILAARENKEIVCIYGDYDVDGITSTAFMMRFLKKIDISCTYYVPNRLTEGYGLSKEGIQTVREKGASLIITVDTGITAVEEVEYAKSLGLDIRITDHHEPQEEEPRTSIIDPKSHRESYPEKNLCGAGVALKLAQALCIRGGFPEEFWQDELDLVALGTAADIVPFAGENRIITFFGYKQMVKTQCLGLKILMELKKLTKPVITTADIVFNIAPAINAAGRLGDPSRGVRLLLSQDEGECRLFAQDLIKKNIERKTYNIKVEEDITAKISDLTNLSEEYAVIAGHADWHRGVVGIAASKTVEKYCRPAFIFSIDSEGTARGSGRSIDGCDLMQALKECEDILLQYGGHAMAAGASLRKENIPAFRIRFNAAVAKQLTRENLTPRIYADASIAIPQLTPKFFKTLSRMQPFGPGNMRPVLYSRNVTVEKLKRVGKKGEHLKMSVSQSRQYIEAIAFGFGPRIHEVQSAYQNSLAYTLNENTFNGRTNLQMVVKGIESVQQE